MGTVYVLSSTVFGIGLLGITYGMSARLGENVIRGSSWVGVGSGGQLGNDGAAACKVRNHPEPLPSVWQT
jgi:hypothetical protein